MISIDEAILSSERRAKRVWLISILWIIIMLATASIIGVSLYQFSKTQREINTLKDTANRLVTELEKTKEELTQLRKTGSAQSRQIYALSLLTLGTDKLTPEQKEFIKHQADEASSQQPTPASLTVEAYSDFIDKKYQASYDTYTEALILEGDLSQAFAGRGLVDLALENFAKANDDLTHALKLDKDVTHRPFLLLKRSHALTRLGKIEEAGQDATEASQGGDPGIRSDALNSRGLVKLKERDWKGAEADFRASADLMPDWARGRLENIGVIYLFEKNWTAAYEWSMKTSKMTGKTGGWMWIIEALAAEKLGKPQERQAAVGAYISKVPEPKQDLDELSFYLPDDLAQLAKSWVSQAAK